MNSRPLFMESFQAAAAEFPERDALVLLEEHDGQLHPGHVTYAELGARVRLLAARLRAHTSPGDRVLVLTTSQLLFAASFLACLHARLVAVPVPPAGRRGHHDERVAGIIKDAAASCVLTERAHAAEVSQLLARTGFPEVTCLLADTAPDAVRGGASGTAAPGSTGSGTAAPGSTGSGRTGSGRTVPGSPTDAVRPAADDVAYLQYTSGSTREPRGVMVTHGNLVANLEAIRRALDTGPASRFGGWLPLHHDMGLVGQLLHPLWLGATTVMLSPQAFVKKPFHWLDTVSRYRLTVSGAPDFAYELCLRRINDSQRAKLDLSGWRTAVDGGEPVHPATLHAFAERFATAGLRPGALTVAYGLAESTLLVSGGRPAPHQAHSDTAAPHPAPPHPAQPDPEAASCTGRTVPCGVPASAEIRIVDPQTGAECADGRIGEIWVRGDSVAPGYWRRPAETAAVFDARLAGRGGHLRTGDLGMLDAEGQLHVTGRITDMIVIAGRNLYPQDLERTVQQVSALFGPVTVFAVPGERERVVVVQELRARSHYDIDLSSLAATVESRIGDEYEIRTGALLFVRPGTVRRTTSGKVERAAMRSMFLRGELDPLHQRVDHEVEQLMMSGVGT